MKKYALFQKRIPILLGFCLFFGTGFSQQNAAASGIKQNDYYNTRAIYDMIANRASSNDKSGRNFFFNLNWVNGVVYFKDGKQYKEGKLQFDIDKNELHFNKDGEASAFAEPALWFTLGDTSKGAGPFAVFCSGYPAAGAKSTNTFYQVLATGPNVHLVKYLYGKSREISQYNEAPKTEYVIKEDWYAYDVKEDKMELINKSVSSIEKALPAYAAQIEELIKGKNSKHFSDDDLVVLMNKINEIALN